MHSEFRQGERDVNPKLVCIECEGEAQGNVSCEDGELCDACHKTMTQRDMTPRYFDPRTVAVLLAPDGSEHPCQELQSDELGALYWCAGRVGRSPQALANLIHEHWNDSCDYDSTYERQERSFTERFDF